MVSVQGIQQEALLDTGASRSLISERLWQRIKTPHCQIKPTPVTLQTVSGEPLESLGEVSLDVEPFGPSTYLICPGLSIDVLLGNDILRPSKGVLDYESNSLTLPDRSPIPVYACNAMEVRVPLVAAVALSNQMPDFLCEMEDHPVFRDELGHCTLGNPTTIPTEGPPIKQKAYRIPLPKRRVVEEELEKMLEAGVIRPSQSPWASPVTLVGKKDGTTRFCVDFRKVNDCTIKDAYPLPLIQDIFDSMQGASVFSTLDLKSGYWQVDMAEEDIPKTAFICHRGLYEFVRLPFGLSNAPSQFQRIMNYVLRDYIGRTCLVYIDDIVVFSTTKEEHRRHLQEILDVINESGMTLKRKKCFFGKESVDLLGYVISAEGIAAQEDKISAINNMTAPQNVKAIQRFLGMTGYYRQLIPRYADIAVPLVTLTKKKELWRWGEEEQKAFDDLKAALTSDRVMAHPDPTKPYRLYTDASNYATGAILTQVDDAGVERPIHYVSKAFSEGQKRWSAIEREAFAIVHALRKLQPYLQGADLTILTDHKPLRSLFQCELKNSKVQRWAMLISEFAPKIEYRKGSDNVRADMLSRIEEPQVIASIQETLTEASLGNEQQKFFPEEWLQAQDEEDQDYSIIGNELYSLKLPYQGAIPYPRLLAPPSIRPRLLNDAHEETGHRGRHALLRRLQGFAVWPGMMDDVKLRIQTCPHCLGNARNHRPTRPEITETPQRPFERVGVDLTGPFLPSVNHGNRYLLCIVDHLTGWAEAIAIKDKRAKSVWEAISNEFFPRYGHPRVLITDNGQEFMSNIFREGCRALCIDHRRTTPAHPQTNGVVERFNRTLKETLRKLVNNQASSWEDQLAAALWSYRMSDSTARRYSPYELLYGFPADIPEVDDPDGRLEHIAHAQAHTRQVQEKLKQQRQEKSKFLPLESRIVKVHDLITIDQPEPVTMSHLRDHAFQVVAVRGKVISYVPVKSDRPQKPQQVSIDRVRVVPEDVTWKDINPRPRRNRNKQDVRRTVIAPLPEPPANMDDSDDSDSSDDCPAAPVVQVQPPVRRGRPKKTIHVRGPPPAQPLPVRPLRHQPPRSVKRVREEDSSGDEEEPAQARLRIAAIRH